jgi:hypothetical protein
VEPTSIDAAQPTDADGSHGRASHVDSGTPDTTPGITRISSYLIRMLLRALLAWGM